MVGSGKQSSLSAGMQRSLPSGAPQTDNFLLDALPKAEYQKLVPHLELVSLPFGKVIFEAGARVTHAYFPTTCIVSLITALERRPAGEVAVVGREGMLGVSLLFEGEDTVGPPRSAVVQSAGHAYRLPAGILNRELSGSVELEQLLMRYLQALVTQIGQTAVCNRHHEIVEQLCRWLLLRLDRSSGCEMQITQAQIANLLGVRREGVTGAAHDLQRAGAFRSQRGRIIVLDRPKLEQRACECYAVIGREYARLLAQGHHRDARGMIVPTRAPTLLARSRRSRRASR
jgi:CRP-like cAMP-binding protein